MGIRFQCPNGHKLHVKSQLAGQHGFCPECNARVQIPTPPQSAAGTPQPSDAETDGNGSEASERGESVLAPPSKPDPPPAPQPAAEPQEIPKAIPKARPVRPTTPPAAAPAERPAETSSETPPAAAGPPPDAAPPPPPPPAAQVQWRLQTVTGEQIGPAPPEAVIGWQTAGLLADEAHVWRTGWPEWRTIGAARAELPLAAPGNYPSIARQPTVQDPKQESVASRYIEKRRRAAKRQLYVSVLLLLLVLATGVTLAVVLNRSNEPADPLPPAAPAEDPATDEAPPAEESPPDDEMGEQPVDDAAQDATAP